MKEADEFRQYAKETMLGSVQAKDATEKRDLLDLANTWTQAALASDRVFGSRFTPSQRDIGEATSPIRP
jgi:hypothetical protein